MHAKLDNVASRLLRKNAPDSRESQNVARKLLTNDIVSTIYKFGGTLKLAIRIL